MLRRLTEFPKDSIRKMRAAFTIRILLVRDFQQVSRSLDEFQRKSAWKILELLGEKAAALRFLDKILSINSRLVDTNPD